MSLELSPAHGAVLGVVAAAAVIHNGWMAFKVGQARKKYNVAYPALYAPAGHKNEKEFNCIQRGMQNSLENLPTLYTLLLTAGYKYPVSASVAGAVYLLGRILYFQGYSTGDPKGRYRGGFGHFGEFGLLGMVIRWSVELLAPAFKA
jgi:glutathione S-transferase